MTNELKQLIEDAAKLLDIKGFWIDESGNGWDALNCVMFNPLNPERGDLMKVAEAAGLIFGRGLVTNGWSCFYTIAAEYTKGDYQSLALAILRAASAVWKVGKGPDLSCSSEWIRRKIDTADDGNVSAGKPCDWPGGCNAGNCLGCGESEE